MNTIKPASYDTAQSLQAETLKLCQADKAAPRGGRGAELRDCYGVPAATRYPMENVILPGMIGRFTEVLEKAFSVMQQTLDGLFAALAEKAAAGSPPPAQSEVGGVEPATPPSIPTNTVPTTDYEKPAKVRELGSSGEFLWKPASEKDGKLVVLAPSRMTGKIKSLKVIDQNGNVLAKGKFSGVANGDREHFRFNKAGAAFPDGSRVEILLKNGNTKFVEIGETSTRLAR